MQGCNPQHPLHHSQPLPSAREAAEGICRTTAIGIYRAPVKICQAYLASPGGSTAKHGQAANSVLPPAGEGGEDAQRAIKLLVLYSLVDLLAAGSLLGCFLRARQC